MAPHNSDGSDLGLIPAVEAIVLAAIPLSDAIQRCFIHLKPCGEAYSLHEHVVHLDPTLHPMTTASARPSVAPPSPRPAPENSFMELANRKLEKQVLLYTGHHQSIKVTFDTFFGYLTFLFANGLDNPHYS